MIDTRIPHFPGVTVGVDSYFWGKTVWPEGSAIFFNVVEGHASDWGVRPFPVRHFSRPSSSSPFKLDLTLALLLHFLPPSTSKFHLPPFPLHDAGRPSGAQNRIPRSRLYRRSFVLGAQRMAVLRLRDSNLQHLRFSRDSDTPEFVSRLDFFRVRRKGKFDSFFD